MESTLWLHIIPLQQTGGCEHLFCTQLEFLHFLSLICAGGCLGNLLGKGFYISGESLEQQIQLLLHSK